MISALFKYALTIHTFKIVNRGPGENWSEVVSPFFLLNEENKKGLVM
jgi:hypothetical protein